MSFETPIAFCIFNRPEKTRRVFDAIAKQKPKRMLIISDGPRKNVPNEQDLVQQTRDIVSQIDWDCDVETNYADINMGCRLRMSSGIDWAFEKEERLIILEDDCLPNPSFFDFCHRLLELYADQPEVMMISGNNFQETRRTLHSYYFSRWTHIWGWATWRRAWQHYDVDLGQWSQAKANQTLRPLCENRREYRYWSHLFDLASRGEIDTWDYAWTFACWNHSGLTILPEVNLVSNIGFDETATHTTNPESILSRLPTAPMGTLFHPGKIQLHQAADHFTYEHLFRAAVDQHCSAPNPRSLRRRLSRCLPRSWRRTA